MLQIQQLMQTQHDYWKLCSKRRKVYCAAQQAHGKICCLQCDMLCPGFASCCLDRAVRDLSVKLRRSGNNSLVDNRQIPDERFLAPAKPCLESLGPIAYCCPDALSKGFPAVVISIWPAKVAAVLHLVLMPPQSVSQWHHSKANRTTITASSFH